MTGTALDLDGTRTHWGELPVVARRVDLVWHGEPVGTLLIGPPRHRRFPAAHDERVIASPDAVHRRRRPHDAADHGAARGRGSAS